MYLISDHLSVIINKDELNTDSNSESVNELMITGNQNVKIILI